MKNFGKFILSIMVIGNILIWTGFIISVILLNREIKINLINFETLKTICLTLGVISTCALTTALGVRAIFSPRKK